MLNEDADGEPIDPPRQGLARELARMNLTLNTYTQWYWKTDLHNLLHFLSLRADPHAQYEIRVYAEAMLDTVARLGPADLRRLPATTASAPSPSRRPCWPSLQRMLAGEAVAQAGSGLSKREWAEMMAAIGRGG